MKFFVSYGMIRLLLPIVFALGMGRVLAQEEARVRIPIDNLFAGMAAGDSALARTAFADRVSLATIMKSKDGQSVIRHESSIADFMKAIGSAHAQPFNEPIWDVEIRIDGNFAQVWAKYAFYLGKQFSHCGVDAFHLFKNPQGDWKIFHLADTRQKEGCVIPKEVLEKFR